MLMRTRYKLSMFFSCWLFVIPFTVIGIAISNSQNGFDLLVNIRTMLIMVCGVGSLLGLVVVFSHNSDKYYLEYLKEKPFIKE